MGSSGAPCCSFPVCFAAYILFAGNVSEAPQNASGTFRMYPEPQAALIPQQTVLMLIPTMSVRTRTPFTWFTWTEWQFTYVRRHFHLRKLGSVLRANILPLKRHTRKTMARKWGVLDNRSVRAAQILQGGLFC